QCLTIRTHGPAIILRSEGRSVLLGILRTFENACGVASRYAIPDRTFAGRNLEVRGEPRPPRGPVEPNPVSRRILFGLMAFGFCLGSMQLSFGQSAEPIKTVVPIAISPSKATITVGGTVYPASTQPGVQLLLLSRH